MPMISLYKKLGADLIKRGQWFLEKAFNVKIKKVVTKIQIINFFSGMGFSVNLLRFADFFYSIPDINVMKDIIKYSWVDRKDYIKEVHDCDDFAMEFKAHLSGIYNINSVALAKHIKVTTNADKEIWHRAVVFLAMKDSTLKAYLLETQTGKFIELENDLPVKIDSWTYNLSEIEF